jgi:predicted transposase YbfD/YdcC
MRLRPSGFKVGILLFRLIEQAVDDRTDQNPARHRAADRGSGGDCALALKGNQGTLHDNVILLLDDPNCKASTAMRLVEADHGRIETRTATVSTEIDWLQKEHPWPGLKAIG